MSMFGPQQNPGRPGGKGARFTLRQPASIAIYDTYEDAQRAVDYLAGQRFPVQNLSIVGTDLKSFERITGELTWGKVIGSAVMNGVIWGTFGSFLIYLFVPNLSLGMVLLGSILIFVVANVITSSIGYATTGGRRDFTSTTHVIATRYEILGESSVAGDARRLLSAGSKNPAVRRPDPAPEESSDNGNYGYGQSPSSQSPQAGAGGYGQGNQGQPQYGQPQNGYGQAQSQQGQDQPGQYGQPQYGNGQYSQPQYGQPQYGQGQYGQSQDSAPASSNEGDYDPSQWAPPAWPSSGTDPQGNDQSRSQ